MNHYFICAFFSSRQLKIDLPVAERLYNPTLTVKTIGNAAGGWLTTADLAASTATCVFLRDQATGPFAYPFIPQVKKIQS